MWRASCRRSTLKGQIRTTWAETGAVGVTGVGQGEYHPTPSGVQMPGSEIHARVAGKHVTARCSCARSGAPLEIAVPCRSHYCVGNADLEAAQRRYWRWVASRS
jgi:hypothetical protein